MKKEFEVDEKKYIVKTPSDLDIREGNNIYAREFNKLLKEGEFLLRAELLKIAKDRGVWGEERDAEVKALEDEFNKLDEKTKKGGYEKSEAIQDALRMQEIRSELLGIRWVLNSWLSQSAEDRAESKRNDYLVSVCILDENNKPVCSNVDDYLSRVDDDKILIDGTNLYQEMMYGTIEILSTLPENVLLKKLGYKKEEKKEEMQPFLENGEPVELINLSPSG